MAMPALCALVVAAGCGADDEQTAERTARPAAPPAPVATPPAAGREPAERSRERGDTSTDAKPPSRAYRCQGEVLRALEPTGAVRIQPNPVDAGAEFQVRVTEPSARVAVVSLAGVSDEPIRADAVKRGDALVATLRMPRGASCGNKLVTVEGDVSAQAYVAVRR